MLEILYETEVNPKNIYWSQQSIDHSFRNGVSIRDAFHKIITGQIQLKDFPPMKVYKGSEDDCSFISYDNRRLALIRLVHFVMVGKLDIDFDVKVLVVEKDSCPEKQTSCTNHNFVEIRGLSPPQWVGVKPCLTAFRHEALQQTCFLCGGKMKLVPLPGEVDRVCFEKGFAGHCHTHCLKAAKASGAFSDADAAHAIECHVVEHLHDVLNRGGCHCCQFKLCVYCDEIPTTFAELDTCRNAHLRYLQSQGKHRNDHDGGPLPKRHASFGF